MTRKNISKQIMFLQLIEHNVWLLCYCNDSEHYCQLCCFTLTFTALILTSTMQKTKSRIYIYISICKYICQSKATQPWAYDFFYCTHYWLHLVNCLTQFYGLFFGDKKWLVFFVENTSARYTFLEIMFQVDKT